MATAARTEEGTPVDNTEATEAAWLSTEDKSVDRAATAEDLREGHVSCCQSSMGWDWIEGVRGELTQQRGLTWLGCRRTRRQRWRRQEQSSWRRRPGAPALRELRKQWPRERRGERLWHTSFTKVNFCATALGYRKYVRSRRRKLSMLAR